MTNPSEGRGPSTPQPDSPSRVRPLRSG
jgi:hypothetical protein